MADTNFTKTGTVASSAGSIYTNPAATVTKVSSISLTNNNTTSETLLLYFVPNSSGSLGTPSATLNCTDPITLLPGEKRILTPQWTLASTNDAIFANTTTASKVVYCVNGVATA